MSIQELSGIMDLPLSVCAEIFFGNFCIDYILFYRDKHPVTLETLDNE